MRLDQLRQCQPTHGHTIQLNVTNDATFVIGRVDHVTHDDHRGEKS